MIGGRARPALLVRRQYETSSLTMRLLSHAELHTSLKRNVEATLYVGPLWWMPPKVSD